jgi:hypothetical protein
MKIDEHTANDLRMLADFYEENLYGVAETNMKMMLACVRACTRILETAEVIPECSVADDIIRDELEKVY